MNRGLIISQRYFKEGTPVDENVDMNLINPTIWRCQEKYIKSYLGEPLYNKILADIVADTLAGDYLTLVDNYIADTLLYYVMYEVQVPLLYKMRNKSVAKANSDNALPISFSEHKYLRDFYKDDAELFGKRLTDYLCVNANLFPEYRNYSDSAQVRAIQAKSTVSVYLGEGGYGDNCDRYDGDYPPEYYGKH